MLRGNLERFTTAIIRFDLHIAKDMAMPLNLSVLNLLACFR